MSEISLLRLSDLSRKIRKSGGGGDRGGLDAENVTRKSHRDSALRNQVRSLGIGDAALRADDDGSGFHAERRRAVTVLIRENDCRLGCPPRSPHGDVPHEIPPGNASSGLAVPPAVILRTWV